MTQTSDGDVHYDLVDECNVQYCNISQSLIEFQVNCPVYVLYAEKWHEGLVKSCSRLPGDKHNGTGNRYAYCVEISDGPAATTRVETVQLHMRYQTCVYSQQVVTRSCSVLLKPPSPVHDSSCGNSIAKDNSNIGMVMDTNNRVKDILENEGDESVLNDIESNHCVSYATKSNVANASHSAGSPNTNAPSSVESSRIARGENRICHDVLVY